MEAKTQNYITIGSFLVAFTGLGFTLYTRSQDQHAEFYEKEQQYRAKTLQSIQSIKEIHKNELQAHKNEFQEYKLKSQELNFQQEKKIENLEIKADHIKNQFEHLHSQTKADNQVLKNEMKSWTEKKFKKKND
jgi:hypothetical protein